MRPFIAIHWKRAKFHASHPSKSNAHRTHKTTKILKRWLSHSAESWIRLRKTSYDWKKKRNKYTKKNFMMFGFARRLPQSNFYWYKTDAHEIILVSNTHKEKKAKNRSTNGNKKRGTQRLIERDKAKRRIKGKTKSFLFIRDSISWKKGIVINRYHGIKHSFWMFHTLRFYVDQTTERHKAPAHQQNECNNGRFKMMRKKVANISSNAHAKGKHYAIHIQREP